MGKASDVSKRVGVGRKEARRVVKLSKTANKATKMNKNAQKHAKEFIDYGMSLKRKYKA